MKFVTFDVLDSKGAATGEQVKLPVWGDVSAFLEEWNEMYPKRKLKEVATK